MRFLLTILGIFALAELHQCRSITGKNRLNDDIRDFVKLVPTDKIREITRKHFVENPDFRSAIVYLESPEGEFFLMAVTMVLGETEEHANFKRYLVESGLNVADLPKGLINSDFFKDLDFKGLKESDKPNTSGFDRFLDDIRAALPWDEIKELYREKLEESPEYANFVERMSSPEAREVAEKFVKSPVMSALTEKLEEHGILALKFMKMQASIVLPELEMN